MIDVVMLLVFLTLRTSYNASKDRNNLLVFASVGIIKSVVASARTR